MTTPSGGDSSKRLRSTFTREMIARHPDNHLERLNSSNTEHALQIATAQLEDMCGRVEETLVRIEQLTLDRTRQQGELIESRLREMTRTIDAARRTTTAIRLRAWIVITLLAVTVPPTIWISAMIYRPGWSLPPEKRTRWELLYESYEALSPADKEQLDLWLWEQGQRNRQQH
jgi:hypothetical protein